MPASAPACRSTEQSTEDLTWIRDEFLLDPRDHGVVVVHGHTPVPRPELRANRIDIDTGAVFTGNLTDAGAGRDERSGSCEGGIRARRGRARARRAVVPAPIRAREPENGLGFLGRGWRCGLSEKLTDVSALRCSERSLENQLANAHSGTELNWEKTMIDHFQSDTALETRMDGRRG